MMLRYSIFLVSALMTLSLQLQAGSLYMLDDGAKMQHHCAKNTSIISLARYELKRLLKKEISQTNIWRSNLVLLSKPTNITSRDDVKQANKFFNKSYPSTNYDGGLVESLSVIENKIIARINDEIKDIYLLSRDDEYEIGDVLPTITRVVGAEQRLHLLLYNKDVKPSVRFTTFNGAEITLDFFTCEKDLSEENQVVKLDREIREQVASYTGMREQDVHPTTRFYDDLGMDSFSIYQLYMKITSKYKVKSKFSSDYHTVGDLINIITANRQNKELIVSKSLNSLLQGNKKDGYIQKVFYATNRMKSVEKDIHYDGLRDSAINEIKYGISEVSIPKNHRPGESEKPMFSIELFDDPEEYLQVNKVSELTKDKFFTRINNILKDGRSRSDLSQDMVVFIHGFNVMFNQAVIRTAQIAFDTKFDGVPVLFSWPSDGSFYSYMSDREDATWSAQYAAKFLEQIVHKAKAKRIHLIAHSMGSQVLIGALNQLALNDKYKNKKLFSNVILAAPDFDADLFKYQIAPKMKSLASRWTIYTSKKDGALNASIKLNSSRRLGMPIPTINGVDVIDATDIEVSPWSIPEFHSYYATKQVIIRDIVSTIKGLSAEKRSLKPMITDNYKYWKVN